MVIKTPDAPQISDRGKIAGRTEPRQRTVERNQF
jgi:hypothetical protein